MIAWYLGLSRGIPSTAITLATIATTPAAVTAGDGLLGWAIAAWLSCQSFRERIYEEDNL